MSANRLYLYGLLLLLAILAYLGGKFLPWHRPVATTQVRDILPLSAEHSSPSIFSESQSSIDANHSLVPTFAGDTEVAALLKEINPSNDWVLGLSETNHQSFLRNSRQNGIQIISQIPEINSVRFRVSDPGIALPFLEKFFEDNQLSPNHPLSLPLTPRPGQTQQVDSFDQSLIDWLGGHSERSHMGKGVKIALLDSGVNSDHPMLKGATVSEKSFLSSPVRSGWNHGTAMASVIAGNTAESSGISPASEILSYRVIDESGMSDSHTVAQAIVAAVSDGANIINLSLGGGAGSEVLAQAVSYARAHGVSVVAAVGNEGVGQINFPAAYAGVLGVSSVGKSGRVSLFSNYGKEVDLAAPGEGVFTAWEGEDYVNFSGTSVSTAIVSAALAAEWSRHPNLSAAEVEQLLLDYANESEKPGFDPLAGNGILSLGRLENRSNKKYTDFAVVGFHFAEGSQFSGGTVPFEVMVQNQGNTWANNLRLEVDYPGGSKNFPISNFGPGEVRREKLFLQGSQIKQGVEVGASLVLPDGVVDFRPDNNSRHSLFTD